MQVEQGHGVDLCGCAECAVRTVAVEGRGGVGDQVGLEAEIARTDFEQSIRPLLDETLEAIDRALEDAQLPLARIALGAGLFPTLIVCPVVPGNVLRRCLDGEVRRGEGEVQQKGLTRMLLLVLL